MKIIKINESQIKILLTKTDLDEKNINISGLSGDEDHNDETKRVLIQMIQQAMSDNNFAFDQNPMIMEITVVEPECISVLVTKLDTNGLAKKIDALSIAGMLAGMKAVMQVKCKNIAPALSEANADDHNFFAFDSIDEAALVCSHLCKALPPEQTPDGSLHKSGGRFYLTVSQIKDGLQRQVNSIVFEYGSRKKPGDAGKAYLREHGEVIIARDAVKKLADYWSK